MTLFSETSLKLMPSNALTGLSNSLIVDKAAKEQRLSATNVKLGKLQGISTIRNPVAGRMTVNSGGEENAAARQEGMVSTSKSWSTGADTMSDPSVNTGGAPVFVPGTTEGTPTAGDVNSMSSEIDAYYKGTTPSQSPAIQTSVADLQQKQIKLQSEIGEIDTTLQLIAEILAKRAAGELPNPALNFSALDTNALPETLKAKVDHAVDLNARYIQNKIVTPFIENQKLLTALEAQVSGIGDTDSVFDLEYGPPISTTNKFILSRDGLYYNSRTEPVPVILPDPTSSTSWNLDYDANKGGRGFSFSEEEAYGNIGTIFNLNANLDRGNPRVADFFLYDDVLQQFEDDKMAQMTETSGHIAEILANGYAASDAVARSYTAQLGSIGSVFDQKISKRKRQLEIAAVYGRDSFIVTDRTNPLGEGIFFRYVPPTGKANEYALQYADLPDGWRSYIFATLEGGQLVCYNKDTGELTDIPNPANIIAVIGAWEEIPRIPINDFSYLRDSDVPFEVQRRVTLFSEDLDSIVAPYQARYVISPNFPETYTEQVAVDMIGYGDWTHRESSGSLSATGPLYKSLTDDIVSEELIACYNFLDADAVTQPSSTVYALNNAAEGSPRLDAKLVGYERGLVFPSGVGQMFCAGTIFSEQDKMSVTWANVTGSYVRLPNVSKGFAQYRVPYNGTKALDNLFYNQTGASLDFWTYVPEVHVGMEPEHRYRLIMANENSGPIAGNYVRASNTTDGNTVYGGTTKTTDFSRTQGLMIGFRDAGNPNNTAVYPTAGLEFIIAPTVGQNQPYTSPPNVAWGHSICIAEKGPSGVTAPTSGEVSSVGMYVPSSLETSSGYSIKDVSSGYQHFNISFDYGHNLVTMYMNGEKLTSSSISDTLGGPAVEMVTPTPV